MELANIKALLDRYFEGNTTLQEEAILKDYFTSNNVDSELAIYSPLFIGFAEASKETSQRKLVLPKQQPVVKLFKSWYSIAAILLVAFTIGGIVFSQPRLSEEEQQALAAYQEAQEAMLLLSESLNKGTENLAYINEFEKGVKNLAIINQFTKTKSKILK